VKRIKAVTVTYEDDTTETFDGTGSITRHATHDQIARDMPPKPSDVNIHYLSIILRTDATNG
jgi:hypothetical protein